MISMKMKAGQSVHCDEFKRINYKFPERMGFRDLLTIIDRPTKVT